MHIKKTIRYFKKNGLRPTFYAVWERLEQKKTEKYTYLEPEEEILEAQREYEFSFPLSVSVVVPAYETDELFLQDLILSVMEQTYQPLELVIADASSSERVKKVVEELQKEYDKLVYHHLADNAGIAENTNRAVALAKGEYVGLLDHDDLLTKDALYRVARVIEESKERPYLVFTDEDKTSTYLEKYYEPNRKISFDREMLLTNNYVCHFSVYRKDVIEGLKLNPEYDGAQDYDLVLRTLEKADHDLEEAGKGKKKGEELILHVPEIVYHWRCHESSTAVNPESKMYAYEAGKRAVEDYLARNHIPVKVSHSMHLGYYRLNYGDAVFNLRPDFGIVGGPLYEGGKICGGAMNADGTPVYEGLRKGFTGLRHRAILQQSVPAVDLRNARLSEKAAKILDEVTGIKSEKNGTGENVWFKPVLNGLKNKQILEKSLIFCNKLRTSGIRIMYDPLQEMK